MGKAKTLILDFARQLDNSLARASSTYLDSPPGVVVFLFHSIIPDEEWSESMPLNYRYALQRSKLFEMVEYFNERKYEFISTQRLTEPLDAEKSYLCVTFDDGYANNYEAIADLEKLDIPATLFATTSNIESGESFWWDVLYRLRMKSSSIDDILSEEAMLNTLPISEIKEYLLGQKAQLSFQPKGDLDRPLRKHELKELADKKNVFIGNHTHRHQNLTSLSKEDLVLDLSDCSDRLRDWGIECQNQLAYPGGIFDTDILEQVKEQRFQLGYTDRYIRNELTTNGALNQPLQLGRFIVSCRRDVKLQCQLADSRYSVLKSYSRYKNPT